MRTSSLFLIAITIGVVAATFFSHFSHSPTVATSITPNKVQSVSPRPSPSPTPALPSNLQIPSIGVNAPVEQVGLDSQNRMDVPKKDADTAWYDLGPRPGETGNAVIDGHLDTVTGAPAVFWNLSKLQNGDQIIITDSSGKKYTYTVTNKEAYQWDKFPLQQVFGSSNQPMLNLITCEGTWDSVHHNYSQRIVVYSKLSGL